MIYEPTNPTPCITPLGDGYVWYVKTNGFLENDEVAVILCNGGEVKHFTTNQIKIGHNATYGVNKKEKPPYSGGLNL
jgi:hypothetical protein